MQTAFKVPLADFIALEPRAQTTAKATNCAPQNALPAPCEVPPDVVHLAVMLTRRCNMSCAHCSVESGPKIQGEPSAAQLLEAVRAARRGGVQSILLTGGEPMLREILVLELLRECQKLGLATSLTSNGFWGKSPERARQTVAKLRNAGLGLLTISYDRYHADYQGAEPAVHIARAAGEAKLRLNVSVTRTAQDADLEAIVAPFEATPHVNLRFYDVQPVGRARDFEVQTLRGEIGGFCNACTAPALTDDGRLTACNGPSYFSEAASPLIVGDLSDEPLEELLRRHREDAILEAIRSHGPAWLKSELESLPGFEGWARPFYGGMCDLCLHLNSDPRATAALRAHLEDPSLVAQRAARRLIIDAARRDELRRDQVNGAGSARVWWNALGDAATLDERGARAILGRADLNWSAQLLYLGQCGLAGPLLPALSRAELQRWAPQFWQNKMREQANIDAMRTLLQRDAMRQIAAVAREFGATGTLLKGGAMLALNDEIAGEWPVRSCCDIDVHFAPAIASRVHARLIELGFKVQPDEFTLALERRHQLPPLCYRGASVEIHQTLLPRFCGAPERAMWRGARRLRSPELRGLQVLAPEALLLHSVLHCSKHLWTHGLKTAYDVAWICERFPDLNWNWLRRLAQRTGMKRGFWTPLVALARELELPVPASFLKSAPQDRRQRKLERIARRHLFHSVSNESERNPWVRHPLYLLQSDSWPHRAHYLFDLAFGDYQIQLRQLSARRDTDHRRKRWQKLGRAVRAWRKL